MCIYPLIIYINVFICVYKYLCAHIYIYIYYSKGWAFNPVGPNSAGPSCKSVPCRPHSLQKPKWSWQTGTHQVSKKGALFGLQKKQFKEEKGHLLFGIYIYIIVYIRAGVSHIYIYPSSCVLASIFKAFGDWTFNPRQVISYWLAKENPTNRMNHLRSLTNKKHWLRYR